MNESSIVDRTNLLYRRAIGEIHTGTTYKYLLFLHSIFKPCPLSSSACNLT